MAEYLIQGETLDAIAEAINHKADTQATMTPAEMVTAIGNISDGGGGDQTISFLDWVQQGSNTTGGFQPSTSRITCKHMLYKCKSISIPSGLEIAIASSSMLKITDTVWTTSTFVGFWNGTSYTDSFTWFSASTFDLTEILNWEDNYVVLFLRHPDNSNIQTSEGNPVVVTYNTADGAFIR